jgi:hypothetical protein
LTSLSFRRNNAITAKGMSAFAGLVNLVKLDLERCPEIHGGLVHLKGIAILHMYVHVGAPLPPSVKQKMYKYLHELRRVR